MTIGVENPPLSLPDLLPQNVITQVLIDSLPDPLVVLNIAGEVCTMNRAAAMLLQEATPRPSGDILRYLNPPVRAVLRHLCAHVLDGQEPYVAQGPADIICLPVQQGEKCFLPRATPLYTPQGQCIGVTVLFLETVRANPPDTEQEQYLATLVHDLRNPLTSLQAAVRLCLERMVGPLTEKQAHLLQIASESCERLQTALESLADRRVSLRTKHSSSHS